MVDTPHHADRSPPDDSPFSKAFQNYPVSEFHDDLVDDLMIYMSTTPQQSVEDITLSSFAGCDEQRKLKNREHARNYRRRKRQELEELRRRCESAEQLNDLLLQTLREYLGLIKRLEEKKEDAERLSVQDMAECP